MLFLLFVGSLLSGGRPALAAGQGLSCDMLFSAPSRSATRQELIDSKGLVKELALLRLQLESLAPGSLQSQVLRNYLEGREKLSQNFGDEGLRRLDSELIKARELHHQQILREDRRQQLQERRRQRQAQEIAKQKRFQRLFHHRLKDLHFVEYLNQREAIFLNHGVFVLYDFISRKKLFRFEDSRIRATDTVLVPPGGLSAFLLTDSEILSFNRQTGQLVEAAANVPRYRLGANAVSQDGRRLIISGVLEARIFDVQGNQLTTVPVSQEFPSGAHRVEMSPDGRFVSFSGTQDSQAIYDIDSGRRIPLPFKIEQDSFDIPIFFATGSKTAWVKPRTGHWVQFDLLSGQIVREADVPETDSVSIEMSEDRQWLVEYPSVSDPAGGVVFTTINTVTGNVLNWQRPLPADRAYGPIHFDSRHSRMILPEQRHNPESRSWVLTELHLFDLATNFLESNSQPPGRTFNFTSTLSPSGRSIFLHNSFDELR